MIKNSFHGTQKAHRVFLSLAGLAGLLFSASSALCGTALAPLPFTGLTHTGISGDPDPVFSGGAVLKVEANRTRNPVIQIFSPNDSLIGTATVNIPEARSVSIYGLARGSTGNLAVSGSSTADDGRFAEFIDLIGAPGESIEVIRTDPFVPRSIALDADGSVWATGNVYRSKTAPADIDPAHSVVRHFDRSGRLLTSFFPEADLHDRVRSMQGFVATACNRVGWISNGNFKAETGRTGSYFEIDNNGKVLEYPLPPIASERGARVTALALTANGSAFATAIEAEGNLQVFGLDRNRRLWNPVSLTGFSGHAPFLLGASEEAVAFWDSSNQQIRFFDVTQN